MANEYIRAYAKKKKVTLWRIAHEIKISEPSMTRKMRFELSKEEQLFFVDVINQLAGKKV